MKYRVIRQSHEGFVTYRIQKRVFFIFWLIQEQKFDSLQDARTALKKFKQVKR